MSYTEIDVPTPAPDPPETSTYIVVAAGYNSLPVEVVHTEVASYCREEYALQQFIDQVKPKAGTLMRVFDTAYNTPWVAQMAPVRKLDD